MRSCLIVVASIIVLAVIVFAGGAYWLYNNLDTYAADLIRSQGSEAAQAEVGLESMDVDLENGRVTLNSLTIANPAGFPEATAIRLPDVDIQFDGDNVTSTRLAAQTVQIPNPQIRLDYAQDGAANLEVLQGNFAAAASEGNGAPTKFVIESLTIGAGELDVTLPNGERAAMTLSEVTVDNLGTGSAYGTELTGAELSALLLQIFADQALATVSASAAAEAAIEDAPDPSDLGDGPEN